MTRIGAWAAPVVALLLGIVVYLSRPGRVVALAWVPDGFLGGARRGIHAVLPAWLEGILPDVLWSFALAWILAVVWRDSGDPRPEPRVPRRGARRVWLALGLTLAAGWEVGQGLGWIPGMFDWLDLVGSIAGYALGVVAGARLGKRPEVDTVG